MQHPRRRKVQTTSMVGLKKRSYTQKSQQNGEAQRYSWGKQKKKKKKNRTLSDWLARCQYCDHHHDHHGGPSVSRMTLSVPLICGYGSGSAGRSWTCRAVRSLGTGSSHLSLGYRLPSGGVLWRTVLDGDALPLAQMTQILKVCASAVCPEQ